MKTKKDLSGVYSIVYKPGENVFCGVCGNDVGKCAHTPLIGVGADFVKAFGGER